MAIRLLFLIPLVMVSGCSMSRDSVNSSSLGDPYASICKIKANDDLYVGKMLRLNIIYETDLLTYTYIHDEKCKNASVVEIGYIKLMKDPSVVSFFRKGRELCARENAIICPLTANLDVYVTFLKDEDGLFVRFDKVNSYHYRDLPRNSPD